MEDVDRWLGSAGKEVSDRTNFHSDLQNNIITSKSKTPPARSFTQLFENTVVPRDMIPTRLTTIPMVATVPLVVTQQNSMEINNLGGNAIISVGRPARSFSHPQLHRIPNHISAEENPVTVNAPMTETILNVQSSVVESRGANAVQSNKNHHIASTVCQISENQNVGARTN
jgi:hypothetical protein